MKINNNLYSKVKSVIAVSAFLLASSPSFSAEDPIVLELTKTNFGGFRKGVSKKCSIPKSALDSYQKKHAKDQPNLFYSIAQLHAKTRKSWDPWAFPAEEGNYRTESHFGSSYSDIKIEAIHTRGTTENFEAKKFIILSDKKGVNTEGSRFFLIHDLTPVFVDAASKICGVSYGGSAIEI